MQFPQALGNGIDQLPVQLSPSLVDKNQALILGEDLQHENHKTFGDFDGVQKRVNEEPMDNRAIIPSADFTNARETDKSFDKGRRTKYHNRRKRHQMRQFHINL